MSNQLFKPIQVGSLHLPHRVVMAPLTRFRTDKNHVLDPLAVEYYSQRSCREGTLIIAEGTLVSEKSGGIPSPGIWSQPQIEAWKRVFAGIHANKSYVFLQLYASGRQASKESIEADGYDYHSAGSVGATTWTNDVPRALTKKEVEEYIEEFVQAAKNAVEAGADGVEIHGANGYLLNEFLDETANNRTDEYGGSIENRSRQFLEIVDRTVEAIGADKVGVRFSPWSRFGEMTPGPSTIPLYSYLLSELEKRGAVEGKRLAFVHSVEPHIQGGQTDEMAAGSNQFFRDIWTGIWLRAGLNGHDPKILKQVLADEDSVPVFGRHFISNPDLVDRLEKGIELAKYNRETFYTPGALGYTDYPRA